MTRIKEVHVFQEDDTEFEGDCWLELHVDDELVYDAECGNNTNEFVNGFLFGLDVIDKIYEYEQEKTNEGSEYL